MGNFHKISVGSAELIAIQDTVAGIPPTAFFDSTTQSDWEPYGEYLDDNGNLTLNIGSWLIQSRGQTILVDTGIGGRPIQMPAKTTPALPSVMEEAGVNDRSTIQTVGPSRASPRACGTWWRGSTPSPVR